MPCILILIWGLEVNADTFEVLTIPYDKIFPERYGQNGQHGYHGQYGHNYQRPGYQQPQRPGYQPNYPNYQQTGAGVSAGDWVCRNPSTGDMVPNYLISILKNSAKRLRPYGRCPFLRRPHTTQFPV